MFDFPYLSTALLVLAGLLLFPYLLGPIVIRFTLRQAAEPKLDPFDANDPHLPPEVARHFRRVAEALGPLGFDVVQALALPDQTPRVKAVVLLLANRAGADAALATVMYADTPEGTTLQTAYVEIVTRFRDGSVVQTNNSEVLSAFPKGPEKISTQFPTVRAADRLYRLHRALVERHGSPAGKILRLDADFKGDAVAYVTAAIVEELEEQIGTGFMYPSDDRTVYRPTWKGAWLMTWGQLWPFKAIRRQRRDHKARRLLAELEGPAGQVPG
jgi:hypothetical protein